MSELGDVDVDEVVVLEVDLDVGLAFESVWVGARLASGPGFLASGADFVGLNFSGEESPVENFEEDFFSAGDLVAPATAVSRFGAIGGAVTVVEDWGAVDEDWDAVGEDWDAVVEDWDAVGEVGLSAFAETTRPCESTLRAGKFKPVRSLIAGRAAA